jgi:hypothetical protein
MAETYTGEVRGGVVVFDKGAPPPPEGTKMRLEPIAASDLKVNAGGQLADAAASTRSWLLAMAREAEAHAPSLPEDMAENHDSYAHGKPRT